MSPRAKNPKELEDGSVCRRSSPRSPISLPVSIRTMDEEEARPVKLHNMSAGGMAIFPGAELSPSSRIEIILSVPYEISLTEVVQVKLNGEIIRVHSDSPIAVAAFVQDSASQA